MGERQAEGGVRLADAGVSHQDRDGGKVQRVDLTGAVRCAHAAHLHLRRWFGLVSCPLQSTCDVGASQKPCPNRHVGRARGTLET